MAGAAVLAEVTRGDLVEAVHLGHAVVVESRGHLLHRAGDPFHVTYMRSAAKPLQALPLVESGGADRLGLTDRELAVTCASHNGEPAHLEAVRSILSRLTLSEGWLACGLPRLGGPVAQALCREGRAPGVLHNNCSGKHAGLLALAATRGWPLLGYTHPDHPVQRAVLDAVAEVAGTPPAGIVAGVDGCTVPTFGLPLAAHALVYARLADPAAAGLPAARGAALARLRAAMAAHPFQVAGSGRLCTDLATVTRGRLVGKVGAEGLYCVSVAGKGWGIAVKAADGQQRGLYPAVVKILDDLGLLEAGERTALAGYHRPPVRHNRGAQVGEVRPVVVLEAAGAGP